MPNSQVNPRSEAANQDITVDRSRLVLLGALSAAAAGGGCSSTQDLQEGAAAGLSMTSGSFKLDGKTYAIIFNKKTGETTYQEHSGDIGRGISEAEYFAAAAKRDARKKKPTITPVADSPSLGGEGGEGGGGGSH